MKSRRLTLINAAPVNPPTSDTRPTPSSSWLKGHQAVVQRVTHTASSRRRVTSLQQQRSSSIDSASTRIRDFRVPRGTLEFLIQRVISPTWDGRSRVLDCRLGVFSATCWCRAASPTRPAAVAAVLPALPAPPPHPSHHRRADFPASGTLSPGCSGTVLLQKQKGGTQLSPPHTTTTTTPCSNAYLAP